MPVEEIINENQIGSVRLDSISLKLKKVAVLLGGVCRAYAFNQLVQLLDFLSYGNSWILSFKFVYFVGLKTLFPLAI
jgi:hypothetical protein